jgi:uroporphyrin-III C-methyltransferase/precorrin-2 dehydrogenase/sirohydrochlorin ferrochelatase
LTTLPAIVEQAEVTLQSLIIIGDVVKLQQKLAWFDPH